MQAELPGHHEACSRSTIAARAVIGHPKTRKNPRAVVRVCQTAQRCGLAPLSRHPGTTGSLPTASMRSNRVSCAPGMTSSAPLLHTTPRINIRSMFGRLYYAACHDLIERLEVQLGSPVSLKGSPAAPSLGRSPSQRRSNSATTQRPIRYNARNSSRLVTTWSAGWQK